MKVTEKEIKKEVVESNTNNFDLDEAFVLWKKVSKSGTEYLSGYAIVNEKTQVRLIGYFNTRKNNPKEPDIRIYSIDSEGNQDMEVCSLWENISKNEKPYLTGMTNDKEKIVAFYRDNDINERPYVRAYYQK